MTDTTETTLDASNGAPQETIFVNLDENVYETNGKQLLSYKPVTPKGKTYAVGLGIFHYETYTKKDWSETQIRVYEDNYWTTFAASTDKEKWDVMLQLQKVGTTEYKKYYLKKKSKDWKVSFGVERPIEVWGTDYWVNLMQKKADSKNPGIMLATFSATTWTWGGWSASEEAISFGDLDF